MSRGMLPRRSILILSTTPPIPRDYGHRNRVFQTLTFFRRINYAVSFLLYPFDREWATAVPPCYAELVESFDYFALVPNSKALHQPAHGYHHEIDEWWDDNIGQHLSWLFARRRFDAFLVNYTFMSKAFEFAPRNTIKVLDTHDLLYGRRELFEKHGVPAEFFYTNQDQEKIDFDRSDIVIAIKEYEKQIIETMTDKPVICLPYWDDRAVDRRSQTITAQGYDHERPLRLGFIGAYNSVNIVNIGRFLATLAPYVSLYNLPVEVVIAGNVCEGIDQDYPFIRKLGFVEDTSDFYASVDAIVAPLEFSTGIKIKTGEALARQVPVLATRNGFDGFRPYHWTQDLQSVAAMCDAIVRIAYGELSPEEVAIATRKAATTAAWAQQRAFSTLRGHIVAASRRILVLVDRPFWYPGKSFDEMVAQSIEFLAQFMPPIVCYISEQAVAAEQVHAEAIYIRVPGLDDSLAMLLDDVFANYNVIATVVMAAMTESEEKITRHLETRDTATWWLSIVHRGVNSGVSFRSNNTPWGPPYPMEETQGDPPKNIMAAAFCQRFPWDPK